MKKFNFNLTAQLAIVLSLISSCAFANDKCEATILEVEQDQMRGSIVVRTDYKIDGYSVLRGETRYDKDSGSDRHIVGMIKKDLVDECSFLLQTPKIEDKFYASPDLINKKKETKNLVKLLKRVKGKKVRVERDK